MFKGVNLKDSNIDNIKFILMKNINEPYSEVPKDYVKNINWKFRDCSTITMEIPNKIFINGKQVDEKLYNLFLGKHQQIIIELGEFKERYIVTQCTRDISVYKGENGEEILYKVKKIECKSYEYSLTDKKFITSESLSRQLYYDKSITTGAIDIADGYLNFLEQDTHWKVKHVSELAKKEFSEVYNEFYININDVTVLNMVKGTTIWEKDFNIVPVGQNVVNLKAMYTHIKSYDSNNKLLIDDKKVHDTNLNKIYTGVKHIKAIYDGNSDYRYAVHYIITLTDNEVVDRWEDLNLFLDNQKVVFSGMILAYEDGSKSETSIIKNRTVESGTYGYLDFLRNNVEKAFDIVLVFDTYNMTISAYDKSEVGENKGLEFSYNFIKSINKKDGYDKIINKLTVSSDQTSIVDENPFGTSYILDYSYHYNNDLMSEELKNAWDRYLIHINGKQTDLFELRLNKNTYDKKQIRDTAELSQLNLAIRDLQVRRVDYQKKNADGKGLFDTEIKNMSEQINIKQDKASNLLKEIQTTKDNIATINVQIKNILKDISLEGAIDDKGLIFTSGLLDELDSITIEDTLEDSFYVVSLGLYNYSKKKLAERNKLNIEFSLTTTGILQNMIVPHGVDWNYYLNVGDFVPLIDGEDDLLSEDERELRIVEIDYNPSEFNISKITLSNSDKAEDDWNGTSNIGHVINNSKNFINNFKPTIKNSVTVNDYINSMLTDGLDASATAIRSRNNRVVYEETEAGFFIEDGFDNNRQLYLGSSMLSFTSDRWLTSKCAISDEGITADYLISRIILGKSLYICNSNSDGSISDEFYIGNIDEITHEPNNNGKNFGLRISENNVERIFLGIEEVQGVRKARLRLYGKNGKGLVLSEDGIILTNQENFCDNLDEFHPILIPYRSMEGVTKYDKVLLTLDFYPYRAYERGMSSSPTTVSSSTTSSGGAYVNTTSGGGGFNISTTSDNTAPDLYGCMTENAENMGIGQSLIDAINSNNAVQVNTLVGNHKHMISHWQVGHSHTVNVQEYDHHHGINIPDHVHSLDIIIPGHSHDLIYKILESSTPNQVNVYVNGAFVSQVSNHGVIDIASYIKIGEMNEIKITNDGNGRVSANLASKFWQTW